MTNTTETNVAEQGITENVTTNQESKNLAILLWVGTLFFGFIPALILFFVKGDDAYIKQQSKEALNWSITSLIGYFIAGLLSIIVIGLLLIPVIGICHLVFTIMGAVATSKGKDFKVPYAIRLIK